MAALITPVLPRAAGATTFETRTSPALIGTPARAAIAATAEGPLEARARVAADAGGIAREILARSRRTAGVGCARLSGEKCDLISGGGCSRGGFAGSRFDYFGFAMSVLTAIVFGFFMTSFYVLAEGHGMFGAIVCGVGFSLGAIGRVPLFDFLSFLVGELRRFRGKNFFPFLGLFFGFVFKFGASDDGIGVRVVLGFFVFGFDKIGGECIDLVFAQVGAIAGMS
jgi:hypothetical protein